MFKPWIDLKNRSRSPSRRRAASQQAKAKAKAKAEATAQPSAACMATSSSSSVMLQEIESSDTIVHTWSNTCKLGDQCPAYANGECDKLHYPLDVAEKLVARDSASSDAGTPRPGFQTS